MREPKAGELYQGMLSVEAEVTATGITAAQVQRLLMQTFGTIIGITEQFTFARMPDPFGN
jgi:hypothetical protein